MNIFKRIINGFKEVAKPDEVVEMWTGSYRTLWTDKGWTENHDYILKKYASGKTEVQQRSGIYESHENHHMYPYIVKFKETGLVDDALNAKKIFDSKFDINTKLENRDNVIPIRK